MSKNHEKPFSLKYIIYSGREKKLLKIRENCFKTAEERDEWYFMQRGIADKKGLSLHLIKRINPKPGILLFVYGTLKKGYHWHNHFKLGEPLASGVTEEKFAMYQQGIPYVCTEPQLYPIEGELFKPDFEQLQGIDRLETGAGYKRVPVTVNTEKGKKIKAEMYIISREIRNLEPLCRGFYDGDRNKDSKPVRKSA